MKNEGRPSCHEGLHVVLTAVLWVALLHTVNGSEGRANRRMWSCASYSDNCAVKYHAFAKPTASPTKLGLDFWMAFTSAATLAKTQNDKHSSDERETVRLPTAFRIILATNYDPTALTRAENLVAQIRSGGGCGAIKGGACPSSSVEEQIVAEAIEAARSPSSKPDVGNCIPPWPFDGYAFYPVRTAYTLKAIAMNATSPLVAGVSRPPLVQSIRSTDAARSIQGPFTRTVFLDSDTMIQGDMLPALDALAVWDVAAVQEQGSFHSMPGFMYHDILAAQWWYRPHIRQSETRKSIKPYYSTNGVYETQFNTGLLAFRSDSECVLEMMRRWEIIHFARRRCEIDHTAWDQCSFPWALRESTVRIGVLPSRFNFREAVGRGCHRPMYDTVGGRGNARTAKMLHDYKPQFKEAIRQCLFPNATITAQLLH